MRKNPSTRTRAPRRALHLIDLENQLCGNVTPNGCRDFYTAYQELQLLGPIDHVIVGIAPQNLADTFALPSGWRRVVGPAGTQSADLAILEAEPPPAALATYDELVLASSDGGFLDLVLRAKAAGLKVTIVSNPDRSPHWQMYVAAHRHMTVGAPASARKAVA